jgi:hypothetical protein
MHQQGRLVCAEMRPATHMNELLEYVMNDESLQAAACVDLDDKPIQVPWMVGHVYQGRTQVFLCSNQPRYRRSAAVRGPGEIAAASPPRLGQAAATAYHRWPPNQSEEGVSSALNQCGADGPSWQVRCFSEP